MDKSDYKFSKKQFFIILFLVFIGLALCVELSMVFYKTNFLQASTPSFCSVSELIDCDGVAKTPYSLSFGVPNSLWGIIVYSVILMLLFVDRIQAKFKNSIFNVFINPRSYIAFLGLLSFLLSMILAGISIFKIHKICYLCFCTYFVDLFIALAAKSKGFFIEDIKITIQDFIKGAREHFILFLIVLIAFVSSLVYLNNSLVLSPKLRKERSYKEFFEAKTNKYAIKGNTLGAKKSKVKMVIYTDLNCPFCRVVNIMVHKIAKSENISVEEVNYPLDTACNDKIHRTLGGHENSCVLAKYALAAKKQDKFWGVVNLFFDTHPKSYDEIINVLSNSNLGLDINQLNEDANSPETMQELLNDIEKAHAAGVNGTPAFEINDVLYIGAMPYDDLLDKVRLAKKRLSGN